MREWKQENITKQNGGKCVHLVCGLSVSFYAKGHYLVMLKWNILGIINQFQNGNTVIVEKGGECADVSVVLYAYCWTILVLFKCINWQTTDLPTEGIHWTAEVAFNHIDYCSCIPSGISVWICLLTALFSHCPFTFCKRVPTIHISLKQLQSATNTSIPRRPFNSWVSQAMWEGGLFSYTLNSWR